LGVADALNEDERQLLHDLLARVQACSEG